jgi:hypothetical protein
VSEGFIKSLCSTLLKVIMAQAKITLWGHLARTCSFPYTISVLSKETELGNSLSTKQGSLLMLKTKKKRISRSKIFLI